jgi:aldehyde:ferredoxin oxidoreductase
VSVGDAKEFLDYAYRLQTEHVLNEENLAMHEEGTPGGAQVYSDAGAIPTRNFSSGTFADMENINSDALLAIRTKVRACYQCPVACRQWHEAGGISGEGPEYETLALCGSNCGVSDLEALMRFNQACNEWGVDTISLGNVVALAMDLTEKGVEDLGLHFGETDSYVEAPALTAKREGVGAELALGTRALAAKYGHPELGFEVKNLELPGFDPRGSFGMSLAYATADRGGCHMRAFPAGDELETGTLPPDSLEGKAQYTIDLQNAGAAKWSAGLCDFWQVDVEQLCLLCGRMSGRSMSEEEFLRLGERVWNLGRLFNLREGVEKDDLPTLMRAEEGAFAEGLSAGKFIGHQAFAAALQEYYDIRGWDASGVPSEAKLSELGIDVRL